MATLFSQSTVQKALTEKPWIQKIDANHYRCMARTLKDSRDKKREHGKYVLAVTFDRDGLPTIESCRDERTGRTCRGFKYHGECFHSAAVAIHVIKPVMRKAA